MTRKSRFNLPGVSGTLLPLSAIHGLRGTGASCPALRGNNREPCFYGDGDYCRYFDDLREAADRNDCRQHAFVLMTSHVHLLMAPMPAGQERTAQESDG
jgi:putative transposase